MKFASGKIYEIRDPIHRSIYFDHYEKAFVDHQVVQRLRFVTQLGFVNFAYPGATHTRFVHSLGVMHLAGRIFRHILTNNEALFNRFFAAKDIQYFYRMIRLGGLLHDIGHTPFSHSLEFLMPRLQDISVPINWFTEYQPDRQCTHEDISVWLIFRLLVQSSELLDLSEAQDICSLIHKDIRPSTTFLQAFADSGIYQVLANIISGEVDADRMDYLLRDSYFSGVTYGNFDLERIVGSLSAFDLDGLQLGVDQNAIYTFEDFLLARYHMFLQVYFHKTPLCFDYYLKQAIINNEVKISISGDANAYLRLTDNDIHHQIRDKQSEYWIARIYNRQPAQLIRSFNTDTPRATRERINQWEGALATAGCRPFIVEASQYLSNLSPFASTAMQGNLYIIKRLFGSRKLAPLENNSKLIERYNERINVINLYCLSEYKAEALKVVKSLPDFDH